MTKTIAMLFTVICRWQSCTWLTAIGLMYSNIPAINTLESVYRCLERPIVYAELAKIRDKLGPTIFPLIPQTYYSHPQGHKHLVLPTVTCYRYDLYTGNASGVVLSYIEITPCR